MKRKKMGKHRTILLVVFQKGVQDGIDKDANYSFNLTTI